jgi:heme-degrading monooxygenase HmoA
MIEVLWEFVVKEDYRGHFELTFGPGGAWSEIFTKRPGFRGTNLLRDMKNPRRYLIVDFWDTEEQREEALKVFECEYAKLNADFDNWTESRAELGVFRRQAEGTVRKLGKSRKRRDRGSQRRSHQSDRRS